MKSQPAVLLGAQEPRIALEPECLWSHADDAAFLATSYGLTPDPWQYLILAAWLGEDEDGEWTAPQAGLSVPRQNGKNGVIEVRELYGTVVLGEKFLHTAHEVKTARKAFKRLQHFFGEHANDPNAKFPELNALVKEIRNTNGQEAIVLKNGGSVEFVARSTGSGRGFSVDVLVLDEAQALTDEQLEALKATISSAPLGNPQTIYTGTPPGPKVPGEVFTRVRASALAGAAEMTWHEWSLVGTVDITDPATWAATNPALGRRITAKAIRGELKDLSEDGFKRERLGMWPTQHTLSMIDAKTWADRKIEKADAPREGRKVYAVKFSIDGALVALSVARRPEEGPVHVELLKVMSMAAGTTALVEWVVDRWRTSAGIVVDGKSHAGAFVNALRAMGVPARRITTPNAEQTVTAHAMFYEAIRTGGMSHLGQGGLDALVKIAGKRKIGTAGGWGWQATSKDGDVTGLDATTWAYWLAATTKVRPGRKVKAVTM